jgi:uncharacterized membrane protein YphA (DoxX/SURF4 family)
MRPSSVISVGAAREGWRTRASLLLLCLAYLQGGLSKALNWPAALAEMRHFGLEPAALFAVGVLLFELAAAVAVLLGWRRKQAAWALAVFTLAASWMANPFWSAPPELRLALLNAFCEHLGLVGGLCLAARWQEPGAATAAAR